MNPICSLDSIISPCLPFSSSDIAGGVLATGLPESERKLIGKKWDTDGMLSEEIPQKTARKPC